MARFAVAGRGIVVYLRPVGGARACGILDASGRDGAGEAAAVGWILADLGVHGPSATAEPALLDGRLAARRLHSDAPRRIAG
jgi:hypothetical protein